MSSLSVMSSPHLGLSSNAESYHPQSSSSSREAEQWNRSMNQPQQQRQGSIGSSTWQSSLHPPVGTNVRTSTIGNSPSPASSSSPLLSPNTIAQQHQSQQSGGGGGSHTFSPGQASRTFTVSTERSTASGSSTPFYSNHTSSSISPSPSPSPSPDPMHSRSHDPARIQALIQVIQQLADSGVTQKFLSQLGIVFKQLHPNLFVKGILKELVDHASHCGLLVLSGPAGQQQVELTVAGQAIAKTWRQNHEAQNQQQLASLKETLQMQASSQLDWGLNTTGGSTTSSNGFKSAPNIGLSFLDDPDAPFSAGNRGTHSLNSTGGSINKSGGSSHSSQSSGHASLNNTGGSSYADAINTTSGTFTSHSKDTARLDLNNIFGPTSSNIFGVTDAEDSELLSSYHDSDLSLEQYRSKSPTHGSGNDSFGNHLLSSGGSNNPTSTSGFGGSYNSNRGQLSAQAPSYNTNAFSSSSNPSSSSHLSHLQIPHPAQAHINGSNIHAFLGSSNQQAQAFAQQQQQQQQQQSNLGVHEPVLPDPSALQLLPPLPTSLEEKSFRGERLKHLKYIFHFRVHPCLNFLQKGSCPFDNKNEWSEQNIGSFDYHSLKTRRRIPRIYQFSNGIFWSYNACRCQAIEKEMRCEKGEGCRYAHNKEEIAYHPSRYKSAPCSYPLRADGSCSRFGLHCAFSHGEHDVRKPIVLKQGMPHKLCGEPTLPMLQEQQQLTAALTGLSLAELNGFSMSGHNNSMSFGGGGNATMNVGPMTISSHGGPLHSSQSQSQYGTLQPQTSNTQHNMMVSHPSLNAAWEPQQQQQPLQHLQLGLHSTDSPPIHFNRTDINRTGMNSMQLNITQPQQQQQQSQQQQQQQQQQPQQQQQLSVNPSLPPSTDLSYGTAPNSPSMHPVNTDPSFLATLDPNQYMCPSDELASEREYFLSYYKTSPCKNQTLACTKGECPSYHFETKRRRNPRIYRYSQEPCVVVRPATGHDAGTSGWRRPSTCRLGDSCEFSHTLLESMYHPLIYKSILCKNFDENDRATWQRCPWKRACAHAHSRAELEYAESCIRELNASSRSNSLAVPDSGRVAWSSSASPSLRGRGLYFDSNGQPQFPPGGDAAGKTPETAENALAGVTAEGNQVQFPPAGGQHQSQNGPSQSGQREFQPSPPLAPQSTPANDADSSMRSVLLKQDTAARILRMQQQQLQPPTQPPAPALPTINMASAAAALGGNTIVDTLRSENVHLLDRLSRYERELYMLKHRLEDRDQLIKTLQWTIETEREEKLRAQNQLEAFRQEITQRILQQQHQAQMTSHSNELHHGHAASAEMAESVLVSPTDSKDTTASAGSQNRSTP